LIIGSHTSRHAQDEPRSSRGHGDCPTGASGPHRLQRLCLFSPKKDMPNLFDAARKVAAGVLIGFESEEDWFEYQLERGPTLAAPALSRRATVCAPDAE